MNFIQGSCQRSSPYFKSTFHWLLHVYCITWKMHISQELAFLWIAKRSPLKCKFWDFRVLDWVLDLPNSSCHFSKYKSVPPQILHHCSVLWHITPRGFFWLKDNIFDKSSTSKRKFSDLPLLALKFTKFLMSFLKPRFSFSSNFTSLFSVILYVTFQATSQFSFKFCITLQCCDT